MESSFTFLRVRGIAIGANWSWLIVFALIAWSLGSGLFPQNYPDLDQTTYYVMGVVTAILFFASILLHELGHAFRALREGMEIDGITLWLFGGVAKFKGMFPSAGAEFRIAIAGPVVSVVLALAFFGVTALGNAVGAPDTVIGITSYLAWINGLVVAFNMVPALPLDGGRVLRSWLWYRQESFAAATTSAARAGRGFAWLLIVIGVLGFITGAGIGGAWFAVLGWFLLQAAQAEASFALLRQTFSGVKVRDLMTRQPETVRPDLSIRDFVDEIARTRGHSTYPVTDGDDVRGLVSIRQAGQVPFDQRDGARVSDVMAGTADIPILNPDQDVFDAVAALQGAAGRGVVMSDGRLEGILSMSDVARALEIEQLRGPASGDQPARSSGILVWVVVVAIMAVVAGFLYTPPVAVISPGAAIDVTGDVSIAGATVDDVNGEYLLTSVRLGQPNGIGVVLAWIGGDRILPLSAVIPRGQDPDRFLEEQEQIFRESQMIAAAAAAQSLGMDVTVTGAGARVVRVVEDAPAADALQEGDVIVAIDGQPVDIASQVSEVIRARPAGTTFTIDVMRDGRRTQVQVESASIPRFAQGFVGIGIQIETHELDVQLPFDISFETREIGGPSAGLAYALAIADMLDPGDYAQGRTVATTGTIDLNGTVGPVGGVDAKAEAADDAGAEIFLVPVDEVDEAKGSGVPVRGVDTLTEAIKTLGGRPA